MDATLNWLWQGGLVATASFVMLLALRRARANARYLVCWAAALLVLALPALRVLSRLYAAALPITAAPPLDSPTMVALPDAWWTSSSLMLVAWMIWIAVHGIRFASAIGVIRRARARSHAFPAHLESRLPHWGRLRSTGRGATLVVSDAVATAAVLGWGPPMIAVAPAMVTLLDADELDRILIHEWAHVQRRDDLVYIPQVAVRAIAGWHPALWWLERRLHVEREIACDEMTVAIAGSPKSYAECLLKLATLPGRSRAMRAAPAALTSSYLRARISRIVLRRKSIAPVWSRSLAAAMVAILALMSIAIGRVTLVATVFSLPFVPRVTSTHSGRFPLAARPEASSAGAAQESVGRRAGRGSFSSSAKPSPSFPVAPLRSEPGQHTAVETAAVVEPTPGVGIAADPDLAIAAPLPSAPITAPSQPAVTADASPSPWSAVAAGGTAIGRTSRDAGVATAGFFTRFAKRVAGSF
jgi:D-alanyl-D-alanine endopeptidase (penicillin-binding protein 7)